MNVLPAPGSLVTKTWPPLWATMPYTVERPRPVPCPGPLVVKNGSKIRSCTSRRHAGARVADRERHVAAGLAARASRAASAPAHLGVGRGDGQDAAARHRVAGVDGEVHQHLLELAGVRPGEAQAGRELGAKLDVLADDPAEHPVDAGDDGVEVDGPELEQLAPAEGEELVGELRRPDCPACRICSTSSRLAWSGGRSASTISL